MTDPLSFVLDLHHADHAVDYAAVAAGGVSGLLHKATEGVTFKDRGFTRAIAQARDAGLYVGAYHFASGTSDAVRQADEFLRTVGAIPGMESLLLALDLEGELDDPRTAEDEHPRTMDTEEAAAFVGRIRALTGRWPLLYMGLSKARTRMRLASDDVRATLAHCPLWLAAYGPNPLKLTPPAPWERWDLQQYTNGSQGYRDTATYPRRTPGCARQAQDRSVFRGTAAELGAWWATCGRS